MPRKLGGIMDLRVHTLLYIKMQTRLYQILLLMNHFGYIFKNILKIKWWDQYANAYLADP